MEVISNAQSFRDPLGDLRKNGVPLSLCNDLCRPNLRMISWSSFFLFVCFCFVLFFFNTSSVLVGKPSTHPVNVSVITNRYLYPWETDIYQSSPEQVPPHWMGWASWGLQAPWGLFNWRMGQEETTCLIVVWWPVPLKDLSSHLWRAFTPKWVMAC